MKTAGKTSLTFGKTNTISKEIFIMFTSKYSHGKKFLVDDSKFEFKTLDQYVSDNKDTKSVKVLGMFTYAGKYGERAAIVTADGFKVTLPDHLVNDVKSIMDTPEEVQAVNEGKCGFEFRTYADKRGVIRNSGNFIDM